MSFADFTSLYGTTQKAKFWCDYMTGLRGQLEAVNSSRAGGSPSVWSRVATREVLLYDVLYGEYFPAVGKCRASPTLHCPGVLLPDILFREKSSDYKLLPGGVWPGPSRDTSALLSGPQQDIRELGLQNIQNIIERTNLALYIIHILYMY